MTFSFPMSNKRPCMDGCLCAENKYFLMVSPINVLIYFCPNIITGYWKTIKGFVDLLGGRYLSEYFLTLNLNFFASDRRFERPMGLDGWLNSGSQMSALLKKTSRPLSVWGVNFSLKSFTPFNSITLGIFIVLFILQS